MRRILLCTAAVLSLWGCSGGGDSTGSTVATTVTITPGSVQFDALGGTQRVHATVLDQKGRAMAGAVVTWASSSPAATVTPLGGDSATITAAANGAAAVTATSGSASSAAQVQVTQVAAQLQKFSGDSQTGLVSAALAVPLRIKLMDRLGNGIAGVTVNFSVTTGGGAISTTSAVTEADGTAAVNWTLGSTTGAQSVTASLPGAPSVTAAVFTATAVNSAVGVVAPARGGNQAVMVGNAVPTPPAVVVLNVAGNPIPGLQVTFSVAAGSGSITGATATTDANGIAAVGSWTLGSAGPNKLTATVNATGFNNNPLVITDYGCEGGGGSGYAITLCYTSTMTAPQKSAFVNAATRWGGLITGDLPNEAGSFPENDCGDNTPSLDITIDDLVIFAAITDIDGPGSVLGQAGPCYIRDAVPQLTVLGVMQFDAADMATLESRGQLGEVILHEMGHVLGIGTLWSFMGLLKDPSTAATALDTYFSGAQGIAGFDAIGGTAYSGGQKVPVENMFGAGTRNSHWRESVLKNELLTGFLNNGENPLSVLTVRSLADLGYTVNAAGADGFVLTVPFSAQRNGVSLPVLDMGDDVYKGPLYRLSRDGRRILVHR